MRYAQRGFSRSALDAIARSRSVERQVEEAADAIRKEASRRAPKETGNLARNIIVEKTRARTGVEYRVGWDQRAAFYGPMVEFGTADTPARPHLRPAADLITNRLRSAS